MMTQHYDHEDQNIKIFKVATKLSKACLANFRISAGLIRNKNPCFCTSRLLSTTRVPLNGPTHTCPDCANLAAY